MESRRYAPRLMLDLAYLHKNYVAPGLGDALRDVLQIFGTQLRQNLHTIQDSCASGRLETLSETAHTLKGAAGSVGALRLADAAEELEDAAEQQQTETVAQLAEELASLGDGTLAAIDALLAQPHDRNWPKPL